MNQIEDFMNRLNDMDWGWWPLVSLRPPKDREIDNRLLLKISPIFGGLAGIFGFLCCVFRHITPATAGRAVIFYLLGCIVFFVVYKFTFAYFWNRRARRLKSQAQPQ
jgi:hypothetical protein